MKQCTTDKMVAEFLQHHSNDPFYGLDTLTQVMNFISINLSGHNSIRQKTRKNLKRWASIKSRNKSKPHKMSIFKLSFTVYPKILLDI